MRWADLLVITDVPAGRALLLETPRGHALPQPAAREEHFWQVVAPVNRAAAALGLRATTLRCFRQVYDAEADELRCYYALELRGPQVERPGWRWAALAELPSLAFAADEQRAAVAAWLAGERSGVAWYAPGYSAEVEGWAGEALAALGRPPTSPVEQVRSWERSALWRAPTDEGAAYIKAAPPVFGHEAALSERLAAWAPGCTAPVLARDEERGLFLMGDAGALSLADTRDRPTWQIAMRRLAELQIALAGRAAELLALGVPDRRPSLMPAWVDALLADDEALRRSDAGLRDDEVAALRARRPELLAACAELAAGAVPASLEHGDFYPTQVLLGAGGPAFIDWSDSSLAHPFLTMIFLIDADAPLPEGDDARAFLRRAYLEPWEAFAPRPQLERLLDAALLLAPMHHALIYHRAILPAMEHGWEMERMLPYYLRLLLANANPSA